MYNVQVNMSSLYFDSEEALVFPRFTDAAHKLRFENVNASSKKTVSDQSRQFILQVHKIIIILVSHFNFRKF